MTDDETKHLAVDTSERGQPVEPRILDKAESIASDTKNNSGQEKETDVEQALTDLPIS